MAGLAGCIEGIQSHFGGIQGVIPIEITNESDRAQNIRLEAYTTETDRHTYDESYSVRADERVRPPHLKKTEQRFRAVRFEGQESSSVDTTRISPETQLVLITVYADDIAIELVFDENEAENVTGDGNETAGGNETTDDADRETDGGG